MYGIEEKVRIQLHKTHIIYKQSVIYHSTCVVIKTILFSHLLIIPHY